MTIDPLIEVADLLRAGKTEEAQKLLRPILKAEPHNLSAWQLAAESMRTPEEKQAVLDLCLRFNPASAAVQPAAAKTETSSSPLQAMTVASA
jgi:predicted Zn-dependent protease